MAIEIIIDWQEIDCEENFYEVFLPQVEAPVWHGRNLDALHDSLVTGQINSIEPPYCLVSRNTRCAKDALADCQRKVLAIFAEAAIERNGVKVVIE